MNKSFEDQVEELSRDWEENDRWKGVKRDYSAEEVVGLRGSVNVEYSLARQGSEKLWDRLNSSSYTHAMGALTGGQAIQMVKGGLEAIYLSGWQVAADGNTSALLLLKISSSVCVHS